MSEMKYYREHEWVRFEGDRAYIGITDHAQQSLGEIVYVELPEIGANLEAGDVLGVVESVKAASDGLHTVSERLLKLMRSFRTIRKKSMGSLRKLDSRDGTGNATGG